MKDPVRIRLPDASIQVDYEHPHEKVRQWSVLLMAVSRHGRTVRRDFTSYDSIDDRSPHLRPCLDFVPPGQYTLRVWRDGLGWARSERIDVEAGEIADAGRLTFQPGGTIRGRIALPEVSRRPQCVVALDSGGTALEAEAEWTHDGYTFVVKDLWPGPWTIHILDDDGQTLVQHAVTLAGPETVEVD